MNLPNKLVTLRLLSVPLILILSYINSITAKYFAVALIIFAWVTDILDGNIARKHKLQTKFGAFYDPFVDKILVIFVFIVLAHQNIIPIWLVLLMIFRDFVTHGIRSMMKTKGKILTSEISGKLKFGLQMSVLLISYILIALNYSFSTISSWMFIVIFWVMIIATAQSYYALIEFLVKNKKVLKALLKDS